MNLIESNTIGWRERFVESGGVCGARGVMWREASTDKSRRPRGWGRLRSERRRVERGFDR
jgi:hypothetical protein